MARDITVARAVLVSNLIRSPEAPDARDVPREEAMQFAKTLLKTCNICTTSNVQVCEMHHHLLYSLKTVHLLQFLLSFARVSS